MNLIEGDRRTAFGCRIDFDGDRNERQADLAFPNRDVQPLRSPSYVWNKPQFLFSFRCARGYGKLPAIEPIRVRPY
jgi:hypothetical protein